MDVDIARCKVNIDGMLQKPLIEDVKEEALEVVQVVPDRLGEPVHNGNGDLFIRETASIARPRGGRVRGDIARTL